MLLVFFSAFFAGVLDVRKSARDFFQLEVRADQRISVRFQTISVKPVQLGIDVCFYADNRHIEGFIEKNNTFVFTEIGGRNPVTKDVQIALAGLFQILAVERFEPFIFFQRIGIIYDKYRSVYFFHGFIDELLSLCRIDFFVTVAFSRGRELVLVKRKFNVIAVAYNRRNRFDYAFERFSVVENRQSRLENNRLFVDGIQKRERIVAVEI